MQAPDALDAQDAAAGELVKFLVTELVAGHFLHADRMFFALFEGQATDDSQTR